MRSRMADATSGNRLRGTRCLLLALTFAVLPLAGARALSAQAQVPPPSRPAAQARDLGLPNFGIVSAQISRGAQPDERGFAHLKRLGIAVVVNLRHEPDRIARERALVEGQGMRYVSIPWRGYDTPTSEQVAQFLRVVRDHPQQKVFVHCQRGAERTGVMIACYRIGREQWTAERALAEMDAFGFRSRFAHLTRFVREFPALLLRDPVLRSSAGLDSRD